MGWLVFLQYCNFASSPRRNAVCTEPCILSCTQQLLEPYFAASQKKSPEKPPWLNTVRLHAANTSAPRILVLNCHLMMYAYSGISKAYLWVKQRLKVLKTSCLYKAAQNVLPIPHIWKYLFQIAAPAYIFLLPAARSWWTSLQSPLSLYWWAPSQQALCWKSAIYRASKLEPPQRRIGPTLSVKPVSGLALLEATLVPTLWMVESESSAFLPDIVVRIIHPCLTFSTDTAATAAAVQAAQVQLSETHTRRTAFHTTYVHGSTTLRVVPSEW